MFDWDDIWKQHDKQRDEFNKLSHDIPCRVACLGDRVLVHAGLLGIGHDWIRHEAVVIEEADTAVSVRFVEYRRYGDAGPTEMWVHRTLITDVIGPAAEGGDA